MRVTGPDKISSISWGKTMLAAFRKIALVPVEAIDLH